MEHAPKAIDRSVVFKCLSLKAKASHAYIGKIVLEQVEPTVNDLTVVGDNGQVVDTDQHTAISTILREASDILNSLLTTGGGAVVLIEGTGLDVVKALNVDGRIDGNGITSVLVLEPLCVSGDSEDILAAGDGFEGVVYLSAHNAVSVNHVSGGDDEDGLLVLVLQLNAAGLGLHRLEPTGIQKEGVGIGCSCGFDDDVFLEAGLSDYVLKVSTGDNVFIDKGRAEVLRNDLCLKAVLGMESLSCLDTTGDFSCLENGVTGGACYGRGAGNDLRGERDGIAVIGDAGKLVCTAGEGKLHLSDTGAVFIYSGVDDGRFADCCRCAKAAFYSGG